jgi:hypothetical protein
LGIGVASRETRDREADGFQAIVVAGFAEVYNTGVRIRGVIFVNYTKVCLMFCCCLNRPGRTWFLGNQAMNN